MGYITRYSVGMDNKGIVHVQAIFASNGPDDLSFKWKTGFLIHRDRETDEIRWGIWDSKRVAWDTNRLDEALKAIESILEHGYYRADTILPDMIPEEGDDFAILLIPPLYIEDVAVGAIDREVLEGQKKFLEEHA